MMHSPKPLWSSLFHLRSLLVATFICLVLRPAVMAPVPGPQLTVASLELPRF